MHGSVIDDGAADRVVSYLVDLDVRAVAADVAAEVESSFGFDERAIDLLVRAGGTVGPLVRRMLRESARAAVLEVMAGAVAAADGACHERAPLASVTELSAVR